MWNEELFMDLVGQLHTTTDTIPLSLVTHKDFKIVIHLTNYFKITASGFKCVNQNLSDISRDIHFDSRNNLAKSSFTGFDTSV